jgi:hypothetical protein
LIVNHRIISEIRRLGLFIDTRRRLNLELPMNLKLFTAVAIFATAHMVAFAQIMTRPVVQTISSDKTKLQAYCELGKLPDQMQKAEDRNHTKAVDALVAKADPLAQQIGPEYLKIVEGLERVDPNSAEGQRFAAVFNSLREKCK